MSGQFTLENKPIQKMVNENGKALSRFRAQNAIYFHSSEELHHFLLKCAVCFILHRKGKRFETEKPFTATKVSKHWGNKEYYAGRNDYDVYNIDDDIPYEILMAQSDFQMPSLIKRKREEYPPHTVFVIYDFHKPDIERIWCEQLVPLWVFQTDEVNAWRTEWVDKEPKPSPEPPYYWNKFGSPFKVYETIQDIVPELMQRYQRELEDVKQFGADAKAISKARRERYADYLKRGMSKDGIDAISADTIGVRSEKAIERRLKKLKRFRLLRHGDV